MDRQRAAEPMRPGPQDQRGTRCGNLHRVLKAADIAAALMSQRR
jgi:hypothetical protein